MKLYQKIYHDLMEMVLSGEFSDGKVLPSEKELQEKYSVSRITVKHAYQLLEEQGFIERIPGKGTVLKSHEQKSDQQMIGVVLCDFDSCFGEKLLKAIEITAKEFGYRVLFARSFDNHENESKILSDFVQLGVSGIIIQNCHGVSTRNLLKLFVQEFPVVSVDRYSKNLLIPSVVSDNFGGSQILTEHLIDSGHKSIMFISSNPESTSTLTDRLNGFQRAFINRNIPIGKIVTELESPVLREGELISRDVQRINEIIRASDCSAVVASEFFVAELCESAFAQLDVKPEIACFDYPDMASDKVMFSHIAQDELSLGRLAVEKLCAVINGQQVSLRTTVDTRAVFIE